jgi:3,4-dihydroxyphenylacetate 2,3-dioxygenase
LKTQYDGTVAIFASGSLSHRFAQNGLAPEYGVQDLEPLSGTAGPQRGPHVGKRRVERLLRPCCPNTRSKGHGEGFMHDTAMLLGALGWTDYDGRGRGRHAVLWRVGHRADSTPIFPVTPQTGAAIPAAQASSAQGYSNGHTSGCSHWKQSGI